VAVDADFFRLGGHSLLAVGLADRLGKRFGVSVPLAELVARPTPAAVAALLEDGEAEERPVSPLLVRLGGGRKGRPLFLLPPAAGSPLCYLDFAVGLASAAPVWGLQCPGLNTAERPLARVDALAEAFAEAIRSVQPHGPYRLAGWSFGGVPAYAVAARLAAEGEPVEFVALLDSGLSAEGGPKPRGTARLVKGLRDLLGLGVLVLQVGKFRRFEDICRLAQAAGISLPRSWQAARRWTTWREALGQAWRSAVVFKANMAAAKAYAAPAYAGHVVLFRAAPEWASDPVIQDVERHAMGQITVRHVTGNHMTIMLHPQEVARFAQAFAETLESIQAGSGGGKEAATVPRVSKQGDSAP
jgi:thioesterase domain-containing protein